MSKSAQAGHLFQPSTPWAWGMWTQITNKKGVFAGNYMKWPDLHRSNLYQSSIHRGGVGWVQVAKKLNSQICTKM